METCHKTYINLYFIWLKMMEPLFAIYLRKTKSPGRIKKLKWILLFLPFQESTKKRITVLFYRTFFKGKKIGFFKNFWSKKVPILISARKTDDECNIHITDEVCLEFHEKCGAECNGFENNYNWVPCMEKCFDLNILECSLKYSQPSLLHNLLSHILNSGKQSDYNCVTEVREVHLLS